MTNKDKRRGGVAKWAPYNAITNGNSWADQSQRVTRVDFTEVEQSSNQRSPSNVLQPALQDHTENEPIRPEDRLVDSERPGRIEVLPTASGSNTVPDIVIHPIAGQTATPAAPLEPEVVEPRRHPSDEGRVAEPADLCRGRRHPESPAKVNGQIQNGRPMTRPGETIENKWKGTRQNTNHQGGSVQGQSHRLSSAARASSVAAATRKRGEHRTQPVASGRDHSEPLAHL
jgi:hypothetical protein